MAPFNKCSCCQVRTRKVIRDPGTRKNIYVCPTCYRCRKYLAKANLKNVQLEEEEAQKNVANEDMQDDGPEQALENEENKENKIGPPEHEEKLNKAEKEKVREKTLQVELVKEMPTTGPTTTANKSTKITPPLMEIVIMNNRKYIAVSETADAVNE